MTRIEEEPIINIAGEKVALGPFHRGMIPLLSKWDNDFEVSFFSGDPLRSMPRETTESRFEQSSREISRDRVEFIVYEKATLRPIGLAELRRINYRSRTADYGILIGEKDCWSKGYGTETTLLMLDYGFSILNLHNITLETYAYNERAIKAYQRAGFRIMGRRREVNKWGGKLYDEIIMDCLSTEFETPLKRILTLP
ncbi:MAG: GNAT family protein [Ktedonobacteraceae bacterium]